MKSATYCLRVSKEASSPLSVFVRIRMILDPVPSAQMAQAFLCAIWVLEKENAAQVFLDYVFQSQIIRMYPVKLQIDPSTVPGLHYGPMKSAVLLK